MQFCFFPLKSVFILYLYGRVIATMYKSYVIDENVCHMLHSHYTYI